MAAFTAPDPADAAAFAARRAGIRADPAVLNRAIVSDGRVVGHIASFVQDGDTEVTYWLGRDFWGRGLATAARPLFARAAADNLASRRVLAKCGFRVVGHDRGYANARGEEIDEVILRLG